MGISPAAEFTGKTERLSVSSQTKVSFVSYYGGDPFNFTNYFLPLSVRYQTEKDMLLEYLKVIGERVQE